MVGQLVLVRYGMIDLVCRLRRDFSRGRNGDLKHVFV